jgi:hypothetical protein
MKESEQWGVIRPQQRFCQKKSFATNYTVISCYDRINKKILSSK